MTQRLHFYFSLSCVGEGNGNPLQCSCLENPKDGGAWWVAVCGVAQSRVRLKQLSSSSSILVSTKYSSRLQEIKGKNIKKGRNKDEKEEEGQKEGETEEGREEGREGKR